LVYSAGADSPWSARVVAGGLLPVARLPDEVGVSVAFLEVGVSAAYNRRLPPISPRFAPVP